MLMILPRALRRDHVAGGELRELEDAGEVDLEDLLPIAEQGIFGGVAMDGAGVVDEDVDSAELLLNGGEELLRRRRSSRGQPGRRWRCGRPRRLRPRCRWRGGDCRGRRRWLRPLRARWRWRRRGRWRLR